MSSAAGTPVRIVLSASGGGQVEAETRKGASGLKDLAQQARQAQVSAAQTRQAYQQLPLQIQDAFVGLTSGQSPLMVLTQQAPQVVSSFGGIRNTVSAVTAVIPPMAAAAGAAAVVLGSLVAASEQAQREQAGLKNAIVASGNAAGTSLEYVSRYAREIASTQGSVGAATEALTALVATGRVGNGELASSATVAVRAQKLVGTAVADTAQAYAALGREPLQASLKLNEGTNYLTAALVRQIQQLEKQGRTAQAAAVAQQAYTQAQTQALNEVERNLGSLERQTRAVIGEAKAMWDALIGIGRPETLAQQLAKVRAELTLAEAGPRRGTLRTPEQNAAKVQALRDRQATLEESQRLDAQAALKQGERVAAERKAIDAIVNPPKPPRAPRVAATDNVPRARAELELQRVIGQAEALKRAAATALEDAQAGYDAGLTALEDYVGEKARLQRQELQADLQIIQARIAAEAAVAPKDNADAAARASRMLALANQAAATSEALARNTGDPSRGIESQAGRDVAAARAKSQREADRDTLRAQVADAERASQARQQAAAEAERAYDDLVLANRQAGIEMIRDDRARGEAQIELFRQQAERRLAALAGDPQKFAAGQQAINDAVALQAAQLSEQLKPTWQRVLQDWQDTSTQMRQAADNGLVAGLQAGEQAFIQLAQTGKLETRGLVNAVIAEFARAQFRQGLTALLRLGSNWLAGNNNPDYSNEGRNYPAPNALGNVYGAPTPFARGGVVTRATLFRFAQGGELRRGLMGEAGPEAIMPLARDASGRLGVRAGGAGGGSQINITIHGATDPRAVAEQVQQELARYERRRLRMGLA